MEAKWAKLKTLASTRKQDTILRFLCGDATEIDWSDADVVFFHGTCFEENILQKIGMIADKMNPGSFFISVSKM